jgi:hypothetical protein
MIRLLTLDEFPSALQIGNRNALACPMWGSADDLFFLWREFGPTLVENQVRVFLIYLRPPGGSFQDVLQDVESSINGELARKLDVVVLGLDDIGACEAIAALSAGMPGLLQLPSDSDASMKRLLTKVSRRRTCNGLHLKAEIGTALPRTFAKYLTSHYFQCDGWYNIPDVVACDVLLDLQRRRGVRGHLLEIGVLKGKSAAHWSMYARADETLTLIDAYMDETIQARVSVAHPQNNCLICKWTQDIGNDDPLLQQVDRYRWLHIDGGHTGAEVTRDLNLVKDLASPDAIIVLDDFFSTRYPQITWAVIAWLADNASEFKPILLTQQKLFICRASAEPRYLQFIKDEFGSAIEQRGIDVFSIFKTTRPSELNVFSLGFFRAWTDEPVLGHYIGPDSNVSRIEI